MFDRRTRARVTFLVELFSVALQIRRHRRDSRQETERAEKGVSLGWFAFGASVQALYSWIYDRDIAAVRTNRWRRVAFAGSFGLTLFRLLPDSQSAVRRFSLGASVGRVCYRFWYGVWNPLPETDCQTESSDSP